MRIALILAGLLLSLAAQPQEIYRWVDKDGIVHYADQPGSPDAKRVELVGLSIYEGGENGTGSGSGESEPPSGPFYQSLSIVQPAQDETFFGAGVTVPVIAQLEGELRPGHSLVFYLDGNRVTDTAGFTARLSGLDRGTHFLRVAVLDENGSTVIASPQVMIHMRQPSVNAPQSPQNRPRPAPRPAPTS
jgi:hypothetical protein